MRRWLGLVLVALAACGQPPATVAVRIEHRARVLPDGGRDLADPTTTSSTAHLAQPKASRSMERPRLSSPPAAAVPPTGDVWWALALCESHGRQDAYNPAGPYFSYFQWSLSSFHSAGGVGDPRDSDYSVQLPLAQHWAAITNPYRQWPVCWPRVHG